MKKIYTKFLIALFMLSCTLCANSKTLYLGGINYNVLSDSTCEVTSYNNSYKGSITIPSAVELGNNKYNVISIGSYAFEQCAITSISMPEGLMYIGDNAFYGCTSLTSIDIPSTVSSIGKNAFADTKLVSVVIPSGVEGIADNTFQYCSKLKSITLPDNITKIGNQVFDHCISLTSISLPKNLLYLGQDVFNYTAITSLVIPSGVRQINEKQFEDCHKLQSVVLPDSLTSIGGFAFYGCDLLSSINIPDSVTSIGTYAFWACHSLTSIIIPASVKELGYYAFGKCENLTDFIDLATEPQPIESRMLFESDESSITIHVLPGCKAKYEAVEGWAMYNIVEDANTLAAGISSVMDNHTRTNKIYNISGQNISAPAKGISIIGGRKYLMK